MPSLVDLQNEWNQLVPLAQERGIRVRTWQVPPHNREYGVYRIANLRRRLGIASPEERTRLDVLRRDMSQRQIQEEWNRLVPIAQARGIRAEIWTRPAPSRVRGMRRLEDLRARLGDTAAAMETTPQQEQQQPVAPRVRVLPITSQIDVNEFGFGIEIECYMPTGMTTADIARAITEAGVQCAAQFYNHITSRTWKIVTDGSLGDYTRGIEVVSPPLQGEEGFRAVRTVANVLTSKGCTIRRSAGFHVHVAPRNVNAAWVANLAKLYSRYEPVIDTVLSPSRRGSFLQWARPVPAARIAGAERATTFNDALRAMASSEGDRYYKVNFAAWYRTSALRNGGNGRDGTVEFRQHQGTTDPTKIENWVKLCLRMTQAARFTDGANADLSLTGLLDVLQATDAERGYFAARQTAFANAAQRMAS